MEWETEAATANATHIQVSDANNYQVQRVRTDVNIKTVAASVFTDGLSLIKKSCNFNFSICPNSQWPTSW